MPLVHTQLIQKIQKKKYMGKEKKGGGKCLGKVETHLAFFSESFLFLFGYVKTQEVQCTSLCSHIHLANLKGREKKKADGNS